jgi:hypothetical protein
LVIVGDRRRPSATVGETGLFFKGKKIMLSEAQLATYHEKGWIIPDFRVPAEVIAEIGNYHSEFIKHFPEFADYCPALLGYDIGFLKFCQAPEILDLIEQILGPDFALWNSSFFAKPAYTGTTTPWHQDGEYWPIRPLATCSVWLAIDDSTPENGCLRVIPGSHKERRLRKHNTNNAPGLALNQELDASEYEADEGVDIVLESGQFSLHDVYLLHGSEANRSPNARRGMTMRFMPTTSLFDRRIAAEQAEKFPGADHVKREIFLMRGADRNGRNTFANA